MTKKYTSKKNGYDEEIYVSNEKVHLFFVVLKKTYICTITNNSEAYGKTFKSGKSDDAAKQLLHDCTV